jgi:WD40 repeat protein
MLEYILFQPLSVSKFLGPLYSSMNQQLATGAATPRVSRRSMLRWGIGGGAAVIGIGGITYWLERSKNSTVRPISTIGGSQTTAATSTAKVTPTTPTSGTALYTYQGHSNWVFAVAWSPDGKYIASGSRDNTVQVWHANNGTNVSTYHGHNNDVTSLAWSPDGKYIVSGSADKTVQVWNALAGKNLLTYKGNNDIVSAVA